MLLVVGGVVLISQEGEANAATAAAVVTTAEACTPCQQYARPLSIIVVSNRSIRHLPSIF